MHGVRRDGAEEVVVQAGEGRGRGAGGNHRHFGGRDLLVGVLDHGAGRRTDHDGRVLGKHRLRGRRVLVGMIRVGRIGGRDFDVFAEHAASRVDVFLRELHGGDVGGAEVRHGTGQREQAGRHERIGFRAAGRAGRSRIGRAGRAAAGEQHRHRRCGCGNRNSCFSKILLGSESTHRKLLSCCARLLADDVTRSARHRTGYGRKLACCLC